MAFRGKKAISPISQEPPKREIIPGKITESQWLELLDAEEAPVVVGELVDHVVNLAFSVWQEHYLEEEVFPYTVKEAKKSLQQIIELQFLGRDEGEKDFANDPSWLEDDEPPPSVIDSWARGIAPLSTLEDISTHHKEEEKKTTTENLKWPKVESEEAFEPMDVAQARHISRQHTIGSTMGAPSTVTNKFSTVSSSLPQSKRKTKVGRVRHKTRHPQTRMQELSCPPAPSLSEEGGKEEEEEENETLSPTRSHTPTSSLSSSPVPPLKLLPYNMKPAQLRWQKDVTYDSRGNIVNMTKLDPSKFPRHRVKPKVWITQSLSHTLTLTKSQTRTKLPPSTLHPSPLSLHTVRNATKTKIAPPTKYRAKKKGWSEGQRSEGGRNQGGKCEEERNEGDRNEGGRCEKWRREGGRCERGRSEGGRSEEDKRVQKGFVVNKRGHIHGLDAEWERGREDKRKVRRQVTRESLRFPEVLTLPPLVDTIDPCAGVTVREGGRVVHGPKSPQKSYRHIVPQRAMLLVQPNHASTILSSEVG